MRKLLLALVSAALLSSPAFADWTGKDASSTTITFKNPNTCSSVVCVPVVQIYDGTNTVTLSTAGADGGSNTLTGVPVYGWNFLYNGTTWDRARGDTTNGMWTNVKSSVLPTGAATSANQPTNAAAASTTSGQTGNIGLGAVTTGAPTYTTATSNFLSLTTAGALRTDASATTQPVSAASLPLPTGASTSAKQPALGTAGSASTDVLSVQGIASMTPFLSNPGTAANWGVGATGSAVPANGIYNGMNVGGNLTGFAGASSGADATSNTTTQLFTAGLGYIFNGTTWDRVRGTSGAMNIAGTGTAGSAAGGILTVQGIASMTPLFVGGDVANGSSDSGNPVKIGGKAGVNVPTPVTDTQRVQSWFDRYGRINSADTDPDINTTTNLTTLRDKQVSQRYTVLADSVADGLAAFWTPTVANGGTNTVSSGEGLLQTSTATNGSAQLVSTAPIYYPGQVAWFNSAIRVGDTGTVGDIRRWGAATVSAGTPQDGFYYELNGTTLNAVVVKAGTPTATASGSWSLNSTNPFTLDTNYHSFEIRWTANYVGFYIDNILRHVVSGTTTPITSTLNFPMMLQNVKTSGATNIVLGVRNVGIGRFGNPPLVGDLSNTLVGGTAWTSSTASSTTQPIMSNGNWPAILVQLNQTSTLTGGAVTFEGTYDGTNWVSVPVAQLLNPNTFANLTNPYTLVASTNQPFLVLTQGYQQVRLRLSTVITGTATVTPQITLLPYNPAIGALLNPLVAGTNVIGKVGIDQTTPGTTNLVALAANQSVNTAQVNGVTTLTGTGASGTGSQRVSVANDSQIKVWDGTNNATVKAASTAPVTATDTAVVVGLRPDSPGIVALGQTTKSASVPVAIASDQVGSAGTANATVLTVQGIASMTPLAGNVTQLNGNAISTSTGVAGTGTQRVTLSNTDPCASPDIAKSSAIINVTSAATTALVAVSGSTTVYVCGFTVSISQVATTANTLAFEQGTGTACATSPTTLTGTYGAGGVTAGPPLVVTAQADRTIFKTAASNGLCALTTIGASGSFQGVLTYVQQ